MATENPKTSDECSICLVPLAQPGLDIFTTACHHQFHFQCLAKNIQAQNSECPLCRAPLDSLVNILKASSNTTNAIPTTNTIPQQQQQQIVVPLPVVQQPVPVQNVQAPASEGLWETLTRSMRNMFSRNTGGVYSSNSSATQGNYHFSNDNYVPYEDRIDETAVRLLTERINAARQASNQGVNQLPQIIVSTTLEFGAQESTKDSNIYGMVTLKAPSLLSNTATEKELDELHVPLDLVCIVDQSGSMGGNKIDLLRDTLNYIVDQMGVLDRLALISFETSAVDQSNGLKLMTGKKKQTLRNTIAQKVRAGGGTYIGSGLEMAIQLLRSRSTKNSLGAMLLLTDGQDNHRHNYSSLMALLPEDVVCHTFGYGSDHDAGLLSQIAEQGHSGTFTYIDQVNAIGPAFATALGGLFTCIAKQIRVKVNFNDEYKITNAHTTYQYQPNILPTRQITFRLNDLNTDETRNLVFQVHIPKLISSNANESETNAIGQASLEYIDANTNQTIQTVPVPFTLARPNQINPDSPLLQVNYTLDVQRNRAETSIVLKKAVQEHNYERARALINAQLEKIRSSVSANDSLCQQLIKDLEYQYASQHEFKTTMTNMFMQHGQERATYSTCATISASKYMTLGQERYRNKFS